MIRMGVSECFFWYWLTWLVLDKGLLTVVVVYLLLFINSFIIPTFA